MTKIKTTLNIMVCFFMLAAFTACKGGGSGKEGGIKQSSITDSTGGKVDSVSGNTTTNPDTPNTDTTSTNNTNNGNDNTKQNPNVKQPTATGGGQLNAKQIEGMFDKVDNMSFSGDKKKAILKILRNELDEGAQTRAIDYILGNVDFGDDKVTLLKRVIQRDNFTPKVKKHLLNNLDELSFASEREKILKVLAGS